MDSSEAVASAALAAPSATGFGFVFCAMLIKLLVCDAASSVSSGALAAIFRAAFIAPRATAALCSGEGLLRGISMECRLLLLLLSNGKMGVWLMIKRKHLDKKRRMIWTF